LFKQALKIFRKIYGKNNPDVALTLYNLALLYSKQGRLLITEIKEEKNFLYCDNARNYLIKAKELFLKLKDKISTEQLDNELEEVNKLLKYIDKICPK